MRNRPMYLFCDVIIHPPSNLSPLRLFHKDCQRKSLVVEDTLSTLFFNSLISQIFKMSRTYPLFNELYSFVSLRRQSLCLDSPLLFVAVDRRLYRGIGLDSAFEKPVVPHT